MTSLAEIEEEGGATILSDSVTTQRVVINIRLPTRRGRLRPRRSSRHDGKQQQRSAQPTVGMSAPFRELRLRREIRFTDDAALTPNSTSDHIDDVANSISALVTSGGRIPPTDVTKSSELNDVADEALVTTNAKSMNLSGMKDNEVLATTTEDRRVTLTAASLLHDGVSDLSALFSDQAEVEYENKGSTRSVKLVSLYDVAGNQVQC